VIPEVLRNRSRSPGKGGHDEPERPVTFVRNRRSRCPGIPTIAQIADNFSAALALLYELQAMGAQYVFSGFGIEILQRSGRYFLGYVAGELVVQVRELELSAEDAALAAQSEQSVYEVILRLTSADGQCR
jgi:hypothetical protein